MPLPDQRPGRPFPLGASWDGEGVNFAIYSASAERVELCLFDGLARPENRRIKFMERTGHVWHCYLPGIRPGQLYGFRAHGPYDPGAGLRFNPSKLLIDPYARALAGAVDWQAPVHAYRLGADELDFALDQRDDFWGVPKAMVIDPAFDWQGDQPPLTPWHQTVLYEVHVKGFTKTHPGVQEPLRGTFLGLASDAAIAHLERLGVTAVELLPVQAHIDSKRLSDLGLKNYWGYDTIAFFAPEPRYASGGNRGAEVSEFKEMVRTLHNHGIEVILDVVYNHTAEGNELGPTLSFRGLDNPTYYRLLPENPRYYADYTGTGNTLNTCHPQALQLVMDSLRYWVQEMHVDGFRVDLAVSLARGQHEFDQLSSFFAAIHQDPVLSRVKLIAEPWDVGEGGYQLGNFPTPWREWNGRYRDATRRFWRGDDGVTPELALRLTGSRDLCDDGRTPLSNINYFTCHDGFTLHDLVSYEVKHNEANGEANRDGTDDNFSANWGEEGPADDEAILGLREQQKRNLLATLAFSQGVPMILGGDEIGRTQDGNNNAYCQDNEVSWLDWRLDKRRQRLLDFATRLFALRRDHPGLRRRKHFTGRVRDGRGLKDVAWFKPDGGELRDEEWDAAVWMKSLALLIDGRLDEVDENGVPVHDNDLLILLNADDAGQPFTLPAEPFATWSLAIDTARPDAAAGSETFAAGSSVSLAPRSLILLTHRRPPM
jgi:glycogen operon protein